MFARLRLNRFIGCNYQQHNIDAGRSSKHVPDEPFMSGDIHEAKSHVTFFPECKTQIDGDASALFFFQTVRMRAGQSFDQRRFAVVDMTGGADDDVPYRVRHEGFEEAMIRPLWLDATENKKAGQIGVSKNLFCRGDFFHDGLRGCSRILCGDDWSADHNVIRASFDGLRGSGSARLVVFFLAG